MQITRSKKILLLVFIGLLIFSSARIAVFIAYHDIFSSYSFSEIAASFLRGLRFDGAIFFTFTAVFWVLMLIPVKKQIYYKIVTWLIFPMYIFIGCFLAADAAYFGYVKRHITYEPFVIGEDIGFLFNMVPVYLFKILIFILIAAFFAVLWKKIANIEIKSETSWKKYGIICFIWCAAIFLIIRGTVSSKPISTIDAFVSGDSNLGNLTLNALFSAFKYYTHKDSVKSSDYMFFDDKEAKDFLSLNNSAPCVYPEGFEKLKKPNIVFILLESWSAYYTDSFGKNNFGLTPEFDALSEKGIKFTRHYSNEKRSIISIQATLTGIPPIKGLPNIGFGLETLAKGNIGKELSDIGYDTIFLQSSRRRSFYMDAIAGSLGFKEYYGMEDAGVLLDYPDKSGSKFGWDYETYMLLAEKLKNRRAENPFMAFVFTGTTHTPYSELPEKFMKFPHEKDGEAGFKNTLIYADWSLGEFFRKIKNEDWFSNTIFIITADHTLGRFENSSFPEDYRVPLLIYSPLFKEGLVDNITSHIDITPTILDLAGRGKGEYLGRSVFCKDKKSFAVISEYNTAGIVSEEGMIKDSFGTVLESIPKDLSEERKKFLEKIILSYYQVEFSRIVRNKDK